jgi:hypothetical protein
MHPTKLVTLIAALRALGRLVIGVEHARREWRNTILAEAGLSGAARFVL